MEPTPAPAPGDARDMGDAPDMLESLQRSDLKRWSPRRAGVPPLLDWWPSYVALAALTLIAVLVATRTLIDALAPFAHVLLIFSFAAALTFAVAPLVGRLEERMPRSLAVAIVFLGLVAALAAASILIARPLSSDGQALADRIKEYSDAAQGKAPLVLGGEPLPPAIQEQIRALVQSQGPDLAARSAGLVLAFLAVLVDVVLVLVVTFYLLLDARRFRVVVLRTLEPPNRPGARRVFAEIARVFGAYLRSQLVVAISLGALVTVAATLVGLPYAILLGAFAGLVELIPMVGPFLGAVPAIVVASTVSLTTVLWTIAAYVLVQQFESNVLVPRLTGNAVGLHPLGALFALVAGFELGGIVGALFAVPVAGLIWVFVSTAVLAWRGRRHDLQRRQRRTAWRARRRRRVGAGTPPR
ncbi:MAG TPA: AI-2E family transporter [Candidatus Limnocylindria bacterium]|nr:AI-2E family transporter [Candidatus Limnocylindria bacterium]